jgi:hypothetical protein
MSFRRSLAGHKLAHWHNLVAKIAHVRLNGMVDLYRIILLDIRMTWLCWCSVRFLSICPLEDLWHGIT